MRAVPTNSTNTISGGITFLFLFRPSGTWFYTISLTLDSVLDVDMLEHEKITSLYPPSSTIMLNDDELIKRIFPEYVFAQVPGGQTIEEDKVKDAIKIFAKLFIDSAAVSHSSITLKTSTAMLTKRVLFQVSSSDTVAYVSPDSHFVSFRMPPVSPLLMRPQEIPVAQFLESVKPPVIIIRPFNSHPLCPVDNIVLNKYSMERLICALQIPCQDPLRSNSSPVMEGFYPKSKTKIDARTAISLMILGASAAGADLSSEQASTMLQPDLNGMVSDIPLVPPQRFSVKGGRITKLITHLVNKDPIRSPRVDYVLGQIMSLPGLSGFTENDLKLLVSEMPNYQIRNGRISVFI